MANYEDERDRDDGENPIDDFNRTRKELNNVQDTVKKIKDHKNGKNNNTAEDAGKDNPSAKSENEKSSESGDKEKSPEDRADSDGNKKEDTSDKSNNDRTDKSDTSKDSKETGDNSSNSSSSNNTPKDSGNPPQKPGESPNSVGSNTPASSSTPAPSTQAGSQVGTQAGGQAAGQAASQAGAATTQAGGQAAGAVGTGSAATAGTGAGATAGATAGTAAAATNPVGWIILAVAAAIAIAKDLGKGDDSKILKWGICGTVGLIALPLFLLITLLMPALIFANMVIGLAKDAYNTTGALVWTFTQPEKVALFKEMEGTVWDKDLYGAVTEKSQRSMDASNAENYKLIIDVAIYKAFSDLTDFESDDENPVKSLQSFIDHPTDYIATTWMEADASLTGFPPFFCGKKGSQYEYYLSLPYPYHTTASGGTITIEEYLRSIDNGSPFTSDEAIIDHIHNGAYANNDLNYAEIFAVFSQAREFNEYQIMTKEERDAAITSGDTTAKSWSYSEFYDMMTDKDVSWLLFECEFGGKDHTDYIYRVQLNEDYSDGKIIFFTSSSVDTSYLESQCDELKTYPTMDAARIAAQEAYKTDAEEWYKKKMEEVRASIQNEGILSAIAAGWSAAAAAVQDWVGDKIVDVAGRISNYAEKLTNMMTTIGSFAADHKIATTLILGGNRLATEALSECYTQYKACIEEIAKDENAGTFTRFQDAVTDMISDWPEGHEHTYDGSIGYFYTMKVTPYGLKELYQIVDNFIFEGNGNFKPDSDFWQDVAVNNLNIHPRENVWYLNQQEEEIRCYLGYDPMKKEETNNGADMFGPAYDDETRNGHETGLAAQLMTELGCGISGRSPISYIEISIQAETGDEIPKFSSYTVPDEYTGAFNPTGDAVILNMADLHVSQTWVDGTYIWTNHNRHSWPTDCIDCSRCRGGYYSGGRFAHGGCIDCSYLALARYYKRCSSSDPYTIPQSVLYTPSTRSWMSSNSFLRSSFLSAMTWGFVSGGSTNVDGLGGTFSTDNDVTATNPSKLQEVVDSITEGRPVIFRLGCSGNPIDFMEPTNRGNVKLTHTNTHYMTIYGYDESYFYVLDSNKRDAGSPALKYSYDFFIDVINKDSSHNCFAAGSDPYVCFIQTTYNGSWTPQYAKNDISGKGVIE